MASKMIIDPPLLNSASPWATNIDEIRALYECPWVGAVTTRTSLLEGFSHDDNVHQYIYHKAGSAADSTSKSSSTTATSSSSLASTTADKSSDPSTSSSSSTTATSTLNTLGYSPITLSEYLGDINEIVGQRHLGTSISTTKKPFILSVTGTADEIAMAYALIANAAEMDEDLRLAMEVNLSCPNIAGKPPPAYDATQLAEYLESIADSKATYRGRMATPDSVPKVGIKLPPYTYQGQFDMVVAALLKLSQSNSEHQQQQSQANDGEGSSTSSVVDFITCTNTLGSSLVMDEHGKPALNSESGTGIGGLAGAALHPLALGNVATFKRLLDQAPETKDILIIGVGGVEDKAGFDRMRTVGAGAVACASALGKHGIGIFEKITKGA